MKMQHGVKKLSLLIFFLLSIMNVQSKTAKSSYPLLPAVYYGGSSNSYYYFRAVPTLKNTLTKFEIPDYKGGFYIVIQLAESNKLKEEMDFDKCKLLGTYLMHYIPQGTVKPNSWEVPNFTIKTLEISSLDEVENINFETIASDPGWVSQFGLNFPDYLMVRYEITKYEDSLPVDPPFSDWQDKLRLMIQSTSTELSKEYQSVIDKLKEEDKYDTILKMDSCLVYINTDYLICETFDDPGLFFIRQTSYSPDGKIKDFQFFLPGIYTNKSMLLCSFYLNSEGSWVMSEFDDFYTMINCPPEFPTSLDRLFCVLQEHGYIDAKTGKGKPVMKINYHVDPKAPSHGATRLEIKANWMIQVDDEYSTISACDENDMLTTFILQKNNSRFLDKFTRKY